MRKIGMYVCVPMCTHPQPRTYLLMQRAYQPRVPSSDFLLEAKQSTGMLQKSKPTYQFSSGGSHPLHLVLLVMCICRMAMFHSGVESFDPMTYGGQPCKRKGGLTICTGVFTACWSAIISCTCCARVSAVFMFFLFCVYKPQPHVTKFTIVVCYAMM